MLFAYARVSTENQNLASQIDAIKLFGVEDENIYCDKDSGKKTDRKGLTDMLGRLRKGDTVYFYDLTRIGRNFKHLITVE
ncbi:recombinase family protein [Lacinutrix sp. Hel_I_90]|uniref:recombinase family protein n=1 Tax=Lacinutrix sp. Hel_I_90 TaxID=1249999 RepID=UPI000696853F|nr:recombinase family protein [Lacinutrix sp. Hel_I_90]